MAGTRTSGKIVFSTTDLYGNRVVLPKMAWEHIARNHPEMAPHKGDIRAVVEDPDAERDSTIRPGTCIAYEGFGIGPGSGGIRVLVQYDDTTHMAGGTAGKIITAYPPDPKLSSNVGPIKLLRGTGP